VALEAVFKAGDFEDFAAIVVKVDELELTEKVFATAFEPEERFEAFAVEEAGLFEVDDEVDDLAMIDALVGELADGFVGFAGEITVEREDADVVVVFGFVHLRVQSLGFRVQELGGGSQGFL
jgi:hypothetical protein